MANERSREVFHVNAAAFMRCFGKPTPDPAEVRRALEIFKKKWGSPGGVTEEDGLTLIAAAEAWLREHEEKL